MKIIDFEKKGNVVRFYLGADNCQNYWGDDWNDAPYDCNAGTVYADFISGIRDIAFPFDDLVLEPCDGTFCCSYTKDDMKRRTVPCIVVVPKELAETTYDEKFSRWVGADGVQRFYFGDEMNP